MGLPSDPYKFDPRALGHTYDTGMTNLMFPKEIHEELISDRRAESHGAGSAGVVSYRIRAPEEVPRAVDSSA